MATRGKHPKMRRFAVCARIDADGAYKEYMIDAHMYFPNPDGTVFRSYIENEVRTTKVAFFFPDTILSIVEVEHTNG